MNAFFISRHIEFNLEKARSSYYSIAYLSSSQGRDFVGFALITSLSCQLSFVTLYQIVDVRTLGKGVYFDKSSQQRQF